MRRSLPRALFLCALLPLLLTLGAAADTIVLKDGRRIQGKVVETRGGVVVVQTGVGRIELEKSAIVEILATKTAKEEFEERFAAVAAGDEAYQLGLWAREKKMRVNATRAFERAVELDPEHAAAHTELGHVQYEGRWMTVAEADRRRAEAMRAQGLVEHEGRWVTVEDKARLDAGLVLYEGEWMTPDDVKRRQGLELFEERWMPLGEALAREAERAVEQAVGRRLEVVVNAEALVAGEFDRGFLAEVADGVLRARGWFERLYGTEPGLALLGGRLAEFYCFAREPGPYVASVPLLVGRTPTIPDESAESVTRTHGFYWHDPSVVSSARLGHRDAVHLRGHCLHHWGHLMVNRLGYDGRILPPWYDEGFASLTEFQTFDRNYVFCRAEGEAHSSGSVADGPDREFDTRSFLNGRWRESLRGALEDGRVPSFDRLCRLELFELELLDVAASMSILDWMARTGGEHALRRFHDVVRADQPPVPARVEPNAKVRLDTYDRAFRAAVGTGWRAADRAWREWYLESL